jgi:hypothetical protein
MLRRRIDGSRFALLSRGVEQAIGPASLGANDIA